VQKPVPSHKKHELRRVAPRAPDSRAFTDHWTARVGYLFADLQHATFTPSTPPGPVTVKFNANLIRLGVDYKF
jgi:hypothetical protein